MVTISGGDVRVRGLSFVEGSQVKGEDRTYIMVAFGTGESVEDVKAWANTVPAADVGRLVEAISDLSGFNDDAQFPDRAGDDAGPDGATV